ncbi:hypothetical protein QR680_007472 [Steinernema hermaphroditum]|uniref:Uncharacterized protein n=1 Tax=Steinernema hermaphroditum TaxID=289476 RepID=A0AA39IEP6_9BILA|nr:hypothetical protein QR680_007472 [Steinernema hermaphroditum]
MDKVPYVFVDRVAELLDENYLRQVADELDDPIWTDVARLHSNKREYFALRIRESPETGGCGIVISSMSRAACVTLEELDELGRFARFSVIKMDSVGDSGVYSEDETHMDTEEELVTLVQKHTVFGRPLMYCDVDGAPGLGRCLIRLFTKKIYFSSLLLDYRGPESKSFLEEHVDSYPYLEYLQLQGTWPSSVALEYARRFLFSRRKAVPGGHAALEDGIVVGADFIKEIVDGWNRGECSTSKFTFNPPADIGRCAEFMEIEESSADEHPSFFVVHDTKKSIIYLSDKRKSHAYTTSLRKPYVLFFHDCTCGNTPGHCDLRTKDPHLHALLRSHFR